MTASDPVSFPEAPSARRVLGRAFDLDVRASSRLRDASLFMAAQFLLVVGPLALVLAVLFIELPDALDVVDPATLDPTTFEDLAEPFVAFFTRLSLAAIVAVLGWIAITIESEIVAITILAGVVLDRPVTLREAIGRSRQTFWRVVRASILVGIPAAIAGAAVDAAIGPSTEAGSEILTFVSLGVGVAVAVPFAYVPAGIVLGDVGARESIARGFRLVGARWSLAIVIALFTGAAGFLQLFAIGAGGDIVARVGIALDLGFNHGAIKSALTLGLILASILAVGTLLFTTIAISVAPQVVAFLALTHVGAGLDRARRPSRMPLEALASSAVPASSGHVHLSPAEAVVVGDAIGQSSGAVIPPRSSFWDQESQPATDHRMVSLPMLVGGIVATLLAFAALANFSTLS